MPRFATIYVCFVCAISATAVAQAPVLFPPEQFDAVDLVPNQSGGEDNGLLETLGGLTDRFEPMNGFPERNKYRQLGRAVGRLKVLATMPSGKRGVITCTATLIAPDKLITNYHCVPGLNGENVEQVKVEFLYLDLGTTAIRDFAAEPVPVEADRTLDFAILKVSGDPVRTAGVAPILFKPRSIENGESLFLIHHPAGQPQRLTRFLCRSHATTALAGTEIRHVCDTLPGSSGALVFADDDFALVGIHHRGGLSPADLSSFNRGTAVAALEKKSAFLAALAGAMPPDKSAIASVSSDESPAADSETNNGPKQRGTGGLEPKKVQRQAKLPDDGAPKTAEMSGGGDCIVVRLRLEKPITVGVGTKLCSENRQEHVRVDDITSYTISYSKDGRSWMCKRTENCAFALAGWPNFQLGKTDISDAGRKKAVLLPN